MAHAVRTITPVREDAFLRVLEQTGSLAAAARAATPWARGRKGGYEAWRDHMRRSPQFAATVEEAKARALGLVESVIARRAVEGVQRPVYQRGVLVGEETVFDNRLLLRLAARLDPAAWSDRRADPVCNAPDAGAFQVTASEVLQLSPEKRDVFLSLLDEMEHDSA